VSELTPELNLVTAEDDDDIADYNVINLKDSLLILDGLFNAATGHAHNGAHQGGQLQFLDLTIGEDLTVNGTLLVKQTATFQGAINGSGGTLNIGGLATLNALDVTTTTRLRGAVTIDGTINGGNLTVTNLTANGTLSVGSNATVGGVLQANGALNAYGGTIRFEGGNNVRIDWRGDLGALYFPYGNGFYSHAGTVAGTLGVTALSAGSITASGNIVSSAQVHCTHLHTPADIQGGKPVYVAGRNAGDSFLRWWPVNAIGPPALRSYAFTGTIPAHNGTLQGVTIAGAGAAGIVVNNGSSLTAVRPGYYSIAAFGSGYNNVGVRIFTEGALRAENNPTPNAPDWLPGIGCQWVGFINGGGQITFQGRSQQATWSGNFTVTFVPTTDYNG
jgi:hypothetical protein